MDSPDTLIVAFVALSGILLEAFRQLNTLRSETEKRITELEQSLELRDRQIHKLKTVAVKQRDKISLLEKDRITLIKTVKALKVKLQSMTTLN